MILLELDPNVVEAGWTPGLILLGLGLVMVLLFRSMRRQFRRADAHYSPGPYPELPVREPNVASRASSSTAAEPVDPRG